MTQLVPLTLSCLQALRGSLGAGREGSRACNYVSGIWIRLQFPCGFLSTKMSDFRQSALSGNEQECKQTLKNTWKHAPRVMKSLLMSSPPISISHRLCQCRAVVASSPSFSRPAARAPRRVCSLANLFLFHFWTSSFLLTFSFFNWLEASREIKSLYYTEKKFTFRKGKITSGNFCHLS